MRIPKRYGDYKVENCPFCGKISVTKNKQGVPVCIKHKDYELSNLKCACGEWLDVAEGKYGPYFRCMNCGNINFKKGIEINPQVKDNVAKKDDSSEKKDTKKEKPKEVTVTSDQLDYMY